MYDFIGYFYDCTNPLRDEENDNILWIYPKLRIKNFIANYLFDNKNANYYFEESTLKKLILIISSFVRYEYENSDDNIASQINELNYPTLILANIYLYEKGILKVSDEEKGIGIMIDINVEKNKDKIFTDNEYELKKSIISLINSVEKSNYTIDDFI